MPRRKKQLAHLNGVQRKSSLLPAESPGTLTVDPDGNSSPLSSKYFIIEKNTSQLGSDYFNQPCISLAKSVLGQIFFIPELSAHLGNAGHVPVFDEVIWSFENRTGPVLVVYPEILVRKLPDGRELRGKIVETEAYLGGEDKASHSKGGKQTPRNAAMFMKPGTLYVYQIYGIYFCMNISSQGEGAAVLLRSLEPLDGLDVMQQLRSSQKKGRPKPLKDWQLCNGPSKLCQAFDINKDFDQRDLAQDSSIWLEPAPEVPGDQAVVTTARIGIGSSGEWAQKPLRFYIRGNRCVSIADKRVERETECSYDLPVALG